MLRGQVLECGLVMRILFLIMQKCGIDGEKGVESERMSSPSMCCHDLMQISGTGVGLPRLVGEVTFAGHVAVDHYITMF